MGIVITRKKQLAAASANNICTSQTPAGAGNLTLNGATVTSGVATLDTARRVLFTPAGAEATNSTVWVVYGTNSSGNAIQETVNGVNNPSTVATNQDFKTVTRISVNKAQAGAVTVGTNTTGSLTWQVVDMMRQPINVGFQCVVSGTVQYDVEYTNQDVNALTIGASPTVFLHQSLVGQTTSQSGSFTDPIAYFRVTITSGAGSVTLTYQQAGP